MGCPSSYLACLQTASTAAYSTSRRTSIVLHERCCSAMQTMHGNTTEQSSSWYACMHHRLVALAARSAYLRHSMHIVGCSRGTGDQAGVYQPPINPAKAPVCMKHILAMHHLAEVTQQGHCASFCCLVPVQCMGGRTSCCVLFEIMHEDGLVVGMLGILWCRSSSWLTCCMSQAVSQLHLR